MKMVGSGASSNRGVDIQSMGGDIEITLPSDFSGTFDLSVDFTDNFRRSPKITSDFPVQLKETDECDYDHDDDACRNLSGKGTSGNGANRVRIRTINGDIIIHKG